MFTLWRAVLVTPRWRVKTCDQGKKMVVTRSGVTVRQTLWLAICPCERVTVFGWLNVPFSFFGQRFFVVPYCGVLNKCGACFALSTKFCRCKMPVINEREWCNFAQFVEHGNRCLDWIIRAAHLPYYSVWCGMYFSSCARESQLITEYVTNAFSTISWWITLEFQSMWNTKISSCYREI